jgi:hypothetical protein
MPSTALAITPFSMWAIAADNT